MFKAEFRILLPDNQFKYVLARLPRSRYRGKTTGYMGSCTDITEHKMQEELEKRN